MFSELKKNKLYAKEMFLLFPKQGSNCSSFQSFKNLKACSVTCQRLKLLPLYADTQLVIRMIQQWPPKSKSTPPKCTVRLNARDDAMTDFSLYKKYVYVHGLSYKCTICCGVHDNFCSSVQFLQQCSGKMPAALQLYINH